MGEGGRIINIGSIFGESMPLANLGLYTMSKFAVAGLTRAWARDLGPQGITVNCVQPGPIDTDMNPAQGPFGGPLDTPHGVGPLRQAGRDRRAGRVFGGTAKQLFDRSVYQCGRRDECLALGCVSSRSFIGWRSLDRSVENAPVFIPLGEARSWPYPMAAHWRSRLRIGHGEGVREQEAEPGTPVTGQLSGATAAPWTASSKTRRLPHIEATETTFASKDRLAGPPLAAGAANQPHDQNRVLKFREPEPEFADQFL